MAAPISVRLPTPLLEALDQQVRYSARDPMAPDASRSAVIQAALRAYLGLDPSAAAPDLERLVDAHEARISRLEELAEAAGA